MTLTIRFANGAEMPYLAATETEEYWGGASRRTLTFQLSRAAAGLDALDALCSEENLARLELCNAEAGITGIHEGYCLKLKLAVERVLADSEKQLYEERIVLKLGKRTFIEQQLHKLGLA